MKKIIMLMIVAVMMFGMSGNAMAYFTTGGDLIRVVYSTSGTKEIATDLGSITSYTAPFTTNVVFNTNNFNFADLGGTADASNSYVVYFADTTTSNGGVNRAWISGAAGTQVVNKNVFSTQYTAGINTITGAYANLSDANIVSGAGTAQVVYNTAGASSYYSQFGPTQGSNGYFRGFITNSSANPGFVSLAALGTTGGYVDQTLFYYSAPTGLNGTQSNTGIATIRTYDNGTTQLNPSAVPVPAAVYLLGSGLLGLAGIRRKISV